jgi:hypothetical protein
MPVRCPVESNITLSFLDYSKPYPKSGQATEESAWKASESTGVLPEGVEASLCDNRFVSLVISAPAFSDLSHKLPRVSLSLGMTSSAEMS